MGHAFWHPLRAFDELPGGWLLPGDDGPLGAVTQDADGRYRCWVRDGDRARPAGSAWTLHKAAQKVWNATHVVPWGGYEA